MQAIKHDVETARPARGRRRDGFKLVRLWVPDPKTPAFQGRIGREAALLRDAPEEQEALAFIDAAADWSDR